MSNITLKNITMYIQFLKVYLKSVFKNLIGPIGNISSIFSYFIVFEVKYSIIL